MIERDMIKRKNNLLLLYIDEEGIIRFPKREVIINEDENILSENSNIFNMSIINELKSLKSRMKTLSIEVDRITQHSQANKK
jgi:hypothetical protein